MGSICCSRNCDGKLLTWARFQLSSVFQLLCCGGALESYLPSTHHLVYLFFCVYFSGGCRLLRNIGNSLPQIEEAKHLPQSPLPISSVILAISGLPLLSESWAPCHNVFSGGPNCLLLLKHFWPDNNFALLFFGFCRSAILSHRVRVAFVDGAATALWASIIGEFWHLQPLFTSRPIQIWIWQAIGHFGKREEPAVFRLFNCCQPSRSRPSTGGKILPAIWPSSLASRHRYCA